MTRRCFHLLLLLTNKVGRLEFQDGKRQRNWHRQLQFYHGRGTVHVHILIWLTNADSVPFGEIIQAVVPEEEGPLRDLVLGSQLDYDNSGWPQRDDPTQWNDNEQRLLLHHPAKARASHCRAYMEDVLGSLKCHCDVQASNGKSMVLQYCSKYLPKFSSSFSNEIVNHEQASGFALSKRILEEYHPLAPEMVCQMANQHLPQCFVGGIIRKLSVPVPAVDEKGVWMEKVPKALSQYMACTWRRDDMTFKEYLRKASRSGTIQQKFQRIHRSSGAEMPLEDWINRYETKGEIMLSPIMYSRVSDKFYGQWLLLNVPFRSLHDLWHASVLKVPGSYRCLALCLHHRGFFWHRLEECVIPSLALEAHSEAKINNLVNMLAAQTDMVESYIRGDLTIADHPDPVLPQQVHAMGDKQIHLAMEQVVISQHAHTMVETAMNLREPEQADEAEAWEAYWEQKQKLKPVARGSRGMAILGPAGSGKTTVIEQAINNAYDKGAAIAVGCPTGLLATSYKDKFPHIDVDTLHGLFGLHRPTHETLEKMMHLDLIVIDEVGQISQITFERLMEMWDVAERRPAIIFVGDFAQLSGADNSRACDSPRWKTDVGVHQLRTMRRCKCPTLRWKLELLRNFAPTNKQLAEILRHKRAPKDRDLGDRDEPSFSDVAQIFRETPETIFATVSRWATLYINNKAVGHFFGDQEPEATVDADPEANPDNFHGKKQVGQAPSRLAIHVGLKLTLTRNLSLLGAVAMLDKRSSLILENTIVGCSFLVIEATSTKNVASSMDAQ